MKKVLVVFLILVLSIFTQSKKEEEESLSDEKVTNEESELPTYPFENLDKKQETDPRDHPTLLKLVESLTSYYQNNGDSSIQKEQRKKNFKSEIKKINTKYVNTDLVLYKVEIEDIDSEKEITKFGLQKIKTLTKQLMKDPNSAFLLNATGDEISKNPLMQWTLAFYLVGCTKCFKENGKYVASYSVPETTIKRFNSNGEELGTETYKFNIKRSISNKEEALKLSKGKVLSLNAKIVSIDVDDSYTKHIKIYLK